MVLANRRIRSVCGADIEELLDAGLCGQVPDRAAKERTVLARHDADRGKSGQHLVLGLAVGREVIFPDKQEAQFQLVITHLGGWMSASAPTSSTKGGGRFPIAEVFVSNALHV
jgi:hypothetical protein